MPTPVTYNRAVDRNQILFFTLKIREGNDYVDISTWSFEFLLKTKLGVTIWDVINADFTRPDIYTVSFQKSIANVQDVPNGLYVISLFVTNTLMTDNQYMTGQWKFYE